MSELTHIDETNSPTMVDVSNKKSTARFAHAYTEIKLGQKIASMFDGKDIIGPKGAVFATAIVAGTMAVKNTASIIPFCHPLKLDSIKFDISLANEVAKINCFVKCEEKTGVEMEALMGAQIAALTIYDMCKAVSKDMVIGNCHLVTKTGGKSDYQKKEI